MQRFDNVSAEIKRVRKQMEEDEQLSILMRGLRGQNLRDSQFADENVRLRLVEVFFFIISLSLSLYVRVYVCWLNFICAIEVERDISLIVFLITESPLTKPNIFFR
jgi:hypothetical protein